MAISDPTEGLTYSNRDIAGMIDQAKNSINDIVGSVKLSSGIKSFAGMDANNISAFETAIDKYRSTVQEAIDSFNPDASTEGALKGSVGEAVTVYLNAMKVLINKYVAVIDVEKKEIAEARDRLIAGTTKIGTELTSDSDSIRTAANNISLD